MSALQLARQSTITALKSCSKLERKMQKLEEELEAQKKINTNLEALIEALREERKKQVLKEEDKEKAVQNTRIPALLSEKAALERQLLALRVRVAVLEGTRAEPVSLSTLEEEGHHSPQVEASPRTLSFANSALANSLRETREALAAAKARLESEETANETLLSENRSLKRRLAEATSAQTSPGGSARPPVPRRKEKSESWWKKFLCGHGQNMED